MIYVSLLSRDRIEPFIAQVRHWMTSIHFTLCSFCPTSLILQALPPPTLSPSHLLLLLSLSIPSHLNTLICPTLTLSLYHSHFHTPLHTHPYTYTTHTHPFLRCEEVLTSSCVNALVAVVFLGAVKPEFAGTYVSTAVQNKFFLIAKLVVVFHCLGRY